MFGTCICGNRGYYRAPLIRTLSPKETSMHRRLLVSLAVAGYVLAAAAVLGFARTSASHPQSAAKRVLKASACPAGTPSERDAGAKGARLPLNQPETPIATGL